MHMPRKALLLLALCLLCGNALAARGPNNRGPGERVTKAPAK